MHFRLKYSFVLIYFLGLLFSSNIKAQENVKREFGDVTIADFFQYDQSYDSTAPAIVFSDVANVFFDSDFSVIMERHTRLKILNESGLDYGDIQLVYNKEIDQEIYSVKASSYNVENGELIERTVSGKEIFDERLLNDIHAKKFTMPNVQAGSIIEYSYKKIMGNPFQMPDWKFHRDIPVEYSSIYMRIPWRFNYHMVFKGTDTEYETDSGQYRLGSDKGYYVNVTKRNLPPIEDLPLIQSRDDFISELFTQLNFAYRNDGFKTEYLKDWDTIADEIRLHPDIGRQRSNRAIKAKVQELTEGVPSDMEKTELIFEFVSESIVWNGRHQVYSEKGIRDTFKDKTGSSGDINLLLHKMLDEAGIIVAYGLTSTRTNGMVLTDYPIVNQFNHFVTIAELDGQVYILDASEGNRSFKLPPVKDLYQLVYVVQKGNFGWIETLPKQTTASDYTLNYQIDESGIISGNIMRNTLGYSAQRLREQFKDADYKEASEALFEGFDEVNIDTVVVRGLDVSSSNTVHYAEFSFNGFNGDSLKEVNYLNPMLFLADEKNLLDRPVRKFPVYFPYPLREIKRIDIRVPEGYIVDEAPEPGMIVLPENKGMLNFQVSATDSTVSITSNLLIGSMFYPVEDYQALRGMFVKLAECHTSPVVIKRVKSL